MFEKERMVKERRDVLGLLDLGMEKLRLVLDGCFWENRDPLLAWSQAALNAMFRLKQDYGVLGVEWSETFETLFLCIWREYLEAGCVSEGSVKDLQKDIDNWWLLGGGRDKN